MKRAAQSISLLALLGLAACERNITDSNLHQVKPGMTSKEVESILGPPTRTVPPIEPKAQESAHYSYIYEQHGKTVEIEFSGDKLATGTDSVKGSFDQ